MIRVVAFLIAVGLVALGFAWLADRPGDVVLTWQGRQFETSLMIVIVAMLALFAALVLILTLVVLLFRSPFMLRRHLHHRRGERAYEAISRGLVAVGAGDLIAARKHAAQAKRIAPAEPLALLLSAQSAQLGGDRAAADSAFRAMAGRTDTKTLGLHGLHVEARRRGDQATAHAFAEEAARENPSLGWAGKAVLEFRCLTGDWAGALELLESNKRALGKDIYRRQRAVMLTARALAAEETDRDNAKAFALEASKLAPTLVPAATLAGRMLAEGGELRKASRIVNKAWLAHPHPDLAQVLSELRFGDAARDRLRRIETLAKKLPNHVESGLALARAALDARQFGKARAALAAFVAAPTRRVALLMAEIERIEHNDEGRAREWLARAVNAAPDPAWTADGHVSERWLPLSPSGRLDGYAWRVPLTGVAALAPKIGSSIEASAPALTAAPAATTPEPAGYNVPATPDKPAMKAAVETAGPSPLPTEAGNGPALRRGPPPQLKPEPVIPLVHAPDDPGPDVAESREPHTEPPSSGWRKIFE